MLEFRYTALTLLIIMLFLPLRADAQSQRTLTDQISEVVSQYSSATTDAPFVRNLSRGDSGPDVRLLQQVLNHFPGVVVATKGVGASGSETDYFGRLTHRAVIDFQETNAGDILAPLGLSSGTGYVGPATRTKLNTYVRQLQSDTGRRDQDESTQPSSSVQPDQSQSSALQNSSGGEAADIDTLARQESIDIPFSSPNNMEISSNEDVIKALRRKDNNLMASDTGECVVNPNAPVGIQEQTREMCDLVNSRTSNFDDLINNPDISPERRAAYRRMRDELMKAAPYVQISAEEDHISAGESVDVTWEINNAENCRRVSTPTSNQWDGRMTLGEKSVKGVAIPHEEGEDDVVFNQSGEYEIRINCTYEGDPVENWTTITVGSGSSGEANLLSANTKSIPAGESAIITWSTSGFEDCTRSNTAGWYGWQGSLRSEQGWRNVDASDLGAGSWKLSLSCTDTSSNERVTDTIDITVRNSQMQRAQTRHNRGVVAGVQSTKFGFGGAAGASVSTRELLAIGERNELKFDPSPLTENTPGSGTFTQLAELIQTIRKYVRMAQEYLDEKLFDRLPFQPFAGKTTDAVDGYGFPMMPCTCPTDFPPRSVVGVSDSVSDTYEGTYMYIPYISTLHKHGKILGRTGVCTLGNQFKYNPLKCRQVNPAAAIGIGPECFEYPQNDGLLWHIGTGEGPAENGLCDASEENQYE